MAKASKSGGPGKRTTIAPNDDKRYIRRNDKGQITESDDQGRSLAKDVQKRAKTVVPSGQGDKGDQKQVKKATAPKKASAPKKAAAPKKSAAPKKAATKKS